METPKIEILQNRKLLIPIVAGMICLIAIMIIASPSAVEFTKSPQEIVSLPQNLPVEIKKYTSMHMPAMEEEPVITEVDSSQEPDNLFYMEVKDWHYPDIFCFAGIFEEYDCMCGNWYDGYDQDAITLATKYFHEFFDDLYTPVSAVYEGVNGGRAMVVIQCEEKKIYRIAMDADGLDLISLSEIWDQYWDTELYTAMRNNEYSTYMREIQDRPGLG